MEVTVAIATSSGRHKVISTPALSCTVSSAQVLEKSRVKAYLVGLQEQISFGAEVVIPAPSEAKSTSASNGTSISNPTSALPTEAVPLMVITGSVPAKTAS
jgi:hypothetical protein